MSYDHDWDGAMLDRPEMVEAFAAQLRTALDEYATFVGRIRRNAEAMWRANPPDGYSSFEAWWRHYWVSGPLRGIQADLESAVKRTFQLEARFRRHRHEIPQKRAQRQAERPAIERGPVRRPVRRPAEAPPLPAADGAEVSFLDLVREKRGRSA